MREKMSAGGIIGLGRLPALVDEAADLRDYSFLLLGKLALNAIHCVLRRLQQLLSAGLIACCVAR